MSTYVALVHRNTQTHLSIMGLNGLIQAPQIMCRWLVMLLECSYMCLEFKAFHPLKP